MVLAWCRRGAQVDQRVFRRLIRETFPSLAKFLDDLGADISCVFAQWFLCMFINFLPTETALRVWDCVLYYNSSTILFK